MVHTDNGTTAGALIASLMDGDPAVRWQVMRDLLGAPDAMDEVRPRRGRDGAWKAYRPYRGRYWFELVPAGAPSRWATLRALRVLAWWDAPA